uniref:hypothetical protein n=1 Tax=Roseburia sp. TaxID=2049040 RepID=UPI003FEF0F50
MKHVQKILGAVVICICILFCGADTANAQMLFKDVAPRYQETNRISMVMDYKDNIASCTVRVVGKSGTSKINVRIVLRETTTNATITSWTASSKTSTCGSDKEVAVKSGKSYTLECVATVYGSDGKSEEVSSTLTKAN